MSQIERIRLRQLGPNLPVMLSRAELMRLAVMKVMDAELLDPNDVETKVDYTLLPGADGTTRHAPIAVYADNLFLPSREEEEYFAKIKGYARLEAGLDIELDEWRDLNDTAEAEILIHKEQTGRRNLLGTMAVYLTRVVT